MTPDESPTPLPRWPWLDRWFTPPGRALLTWLALAALSGWVLVHGGETGIDHMVDFVFDQMERALAMPLPAWMRQSAAMSNVMLLWFWFEPLVLRLNLPRGLAWLGLRIVPHTAGSAFYFGFVAKFGWTGVIFASSVLAALALCGWRSRPAVSLLGGALAAAVFYFNHEVDSKVPPWLWTSAVNLPYAAVLLYGTRRLPR